MLSKTAVHHFAGTNVALGTAAGKLFRVGYVIYLFILLGSLVRSLRFLPGSHAPRTDHLLFYDLNPEYWNYPRAHPSAPLARLSSVPFITVLVGDSTNVYTL